MKQTIVVYRIGQLGDTLVSIPAMIAIRQKYPEHDLVLLTEKAKNKRHIISSWDVLGPTGWFEKVIFYHPATNVIAKLCTMFSVLLKLRWVKPDIVIDLSPERDAQQASRDKFFFTNLVGARNYLSYGPYPQHNRLSNGQLPRVIPEWQRLHDIVSDDPLVDFNLPIPPSEKNTIDSLFAAQFVGEDVRIVAIGPGSKMQAKKWPEECFVELGKSLLQTYPDIVLVVLGGKEDTDVGDRLCSSWGSRSFNYAGRFSIYGSYAFLRKCFAYIGNDTGTMHLAAIANVPSIALFSARDYPGKWEPYGHNNIIVRHETPCSGCMLEICNKNNLCTKLITVDEVFVAFMAIYI